MVLFLTMLKLHDDKKITTPGRLTGCYLIAYGVLRFALENLRDDMVGPLAAGLLRYQWVSLAVMATGLVVLAVNPRDTALESQCA